MYGCFLDASKAFDKVHYGKLFSLLMSKCLHNVVVRFILNVYIRQPACIQWEGYSRVASTHPIAISKGALFPRLSFLLTMTS